MNFPLFCRRSGMVITGLFAMVIAGATPGPDQDAPPAFTDTLSVSDQAAAGLGTLTEGELATFNQLVHQELTLARQGNITGFAGTFTGRRSPEQRTTTGLERLSAEQRAHIDTLVAYRLAAPTLALWVPRSTGKDRSEAARRPSPFPVRSSVSLTYGAGSGGTRFYGGSMTTTYDDPGGRFSATVSISEYHISGSRQDVPVTTRAGRPRR